VEGRDLVVAKIRLLAPPKDGVFAKEEGLHEGCVELGGADKRPREERVR